MKGTPMKLRPFLVGCTLLLITVCGIVSALAFWRRNDIANIWDVLALTMEQSYTDPLTTHEEVLTYLESHPDTFGLIAYTVNTDGSPVEESIIAHNADDPFTLASTIKIVVLGAYAREVEAGRLDPDQPITLAEWERFYLPNTDGGAHPAALDDLQIPHSNGYATDPSQTVTLEQIAGAMIRFSDNAATDVLLYRIGQEALTAVITESNLTQQEPPVPLSGAFLLFQNHEHPTLTESRLGELKVLSREAFLAQAQALGDRLQGDDVWYQAEREWRIARAPTIPVRAQADVVALTPHGSARDYATIMGQVATNTFISPEVTAIMRRHLEWPMQFEGNQAEFTALGTKGGSLPGILTGATYYIPKAGDFAGQPRVVVLFMNDMPFSAWLTLIGNFAQQAFERELAINQTFAERVRESLQPLQ
jgi:D-alanyl-D-alanine carboxypeptidase